MRILILGDINSAHIQKWSMALSMNGMTIAIYSMDIPKHDWYINERIELISETVGETKRNLLSKLSYYKHRRQVKLAINKFKPDIVHAHYASSYGMLARQSGFSPYAVSVWGSDVFDFPRKNFLTSTILKKNLYSASVILATGEALKTETKKYTHKEISVIPFGIDVQFFKPMLKENDSDIITLGIVKSMEDIYGIDILIDAFNFLYSENKNLRLKLVGEGSKLNSYKLRVESMGLENVVAFTGRRNLFELPSTFAELDICVFPSRMESFGVAQLEASSCGKPVVATKIGGIPEVVIHDKTGILIEDASEVQLCKALDKLIKDAALRKKMGEEGRNFVVEKYNLNDNVREMISIYERMIK